MYLNLDIRHTSKASQQSRCSLHGIPTNLNPNAWLPSCIGDAKRARVIKKQGKNNFEIFNFISKSKTKTKKIVIKSIAVRNFFGGLFNLIRGDIGYVDIPPIVATLAGLAVAILIKAYLGRVINIQFLIILAILVLIPAIISFVWDEKCEGKQLIIWDEKYTGKFVNNSTKQAKNGPINNQ